MKVLIIEDEAPAFRRLQKVLAEVDDSIEIVEVIDSVEDSIKWFRNHQAPELVFMDIQLSDGISFEIFEQTPVTSPVIFTTAFDEYMLRAFKVNSIDYLLKPIKREDLELSLAKYRQLREAFGSQEETKPAVDLAALLKTIRLDDRKYKTRFLIKQGDKFLSLDVDDIAHFYTRHGVVHVVNLAGHTHLIDQTLDEISQQLDPEKFYRANRQFIVCIHSIEMAHRYHKGKILLQLKPAASEEVIVSAERASDFKDWFGE
ncbi:MAG: LytTR family DNA-binding domain-containing protein [Bacteroidota bacterium]